MFPFCCQHSSSQFGTHYPTDSDLADEALAGQECRLAPGGVKRMSLPPSFRRSRTASAAY
jgi:hypothetical protein